MHVHVSSDSGEAKFWLRPQLELARNAGLSRRELSEVEHIIEEHAHEFALSWVQHFGG